MPTAVPPICPRLSRRHGLSDPWRIRQAQRWCPVRYVVFDVLYHAGRCLLHEPLARRREVRLGCATSSMRPTCNSPKAWRAKAGPCTRRRWRRAMRGSWPSIWRRRIGPDDARPRGGSPSPGRGGPVKVAMSFRTETSGSRYRPSGPERRQLQTRNKKLQGCR
jgi:hypothetical protein